MFFTPLLNLAVSCFMLGVIGVSTKPNPIPKLGENYPVDFEILFGAGDYDLIGGGLTLCIGIEI